MSDKLNQIVQKQQKQIHQPQNIDEDIVQLVGFVIGEEEYAIPILNIVEIIKPIDFTRVPSVPEYVLGVFNIRGSVIPLIDLRRKFNLPPMNNTNDTRYIVMKGESNTAGFVIDRLTEAIRIKADRIDPAPDSSGGEKGVVYGIGKREESMLTILKVEALLRRDF